MGKKSNNVPRVTKPVPVLELGEIQTLLTMLSLATIRGEDADAIIALRTKLVAIANALPNTNASTNEAPTEAIEA